jgi:ferredoxin
MKNLKKIRVIVSVSFASMFLWAFLAPVRPNEYFTHTITALQFFPSLLEFTVSFLSGGGSGYLLIILLTFFYGRVYCSTLCPLGTLQDGIIRFRSRKPKNKLKHTKPMYWILYPVTVIVLILLAMGVPSALNMVEPYSNFGRITVNLLKPLLVFLNNISEYALNTFDIAILRPSFMHYKSAGVLGFVSGFFLMILGLALYKGRVYCNTMCPVGGILSFIARFSRNKLEISKEKCTSCGLCEKSCKSTCIDLVEKKLDFSRCVSCFNCLNECKFGAVEYADTWKMEKPRSYSPSRRRAINAIWTAAAGLAMTMAGVNRVMAQISSKLLPAWRVNNIIPPGSISLKHFTSRCTGCNLCVTSCPTKVIAPSFAETGAGSLLQVRMDYDNAYCNYNCTICSHVCPTGAIVALSEAKKKLTQIGVAKFVRSECVVVKKGTVCATCNEHCPTKAVQMVPYKKDLNIPQVNEKTCIGCGACEHVCPARPKAIYVQPNEVHKTAEKPVEMKRRTMDFKEFPF